MDMYASIDTHYPARKNASSVDTDATSSANVTYGRAKPVPFTTTLSISNVDCDMFHLTAILAYLNGSTTTLTGTDYINVGEVPSSVSPCLCLYCLILLTRDTHADEEHHHQGCGVSRDAQCVLHRPGLPVAVDRPVCPGSRP
jgi:hypothetical protein